MRLLTLAGPLNNLLNGYVDEFIPGETSFKHLLLAYNSKWCLAFFLLKLWVPTNISWKPTREFPPLAGERKFQGPPKWWQIVATQNTTCNLDFAFVIQNIVSQMVGCYNFQLLDCKGNLLCNLLVVAMFAPTQPGPPSRVASHGWTGRKYPLQLPYTASDQVEMLRVGATGLVQLASGRATCLRAPPDSADARAQPFWSSEYPTFKTTVSFRPLASTFPGLPSWDIILPSHRQWGKRVPFFWPLNTYCDCDARGLSEPLKLQKHTTKEA